MATAASIEKVVKEFQRSKLPSVSVKDLLDLENELSGPPSLIARLLGRLSIGAASPVTRDAMVNLLKYLQVGMVKWYEIAYDDLYYKLSRDEGLACLRTIVPDRSRDLQQPAGPRNVQQSGALNLNDDGNEAQLAAQLQFYLGHAELAKKRLDELVDDVAKDFDGCRPKHAEVKSLESTKRKAKAFCRGDVSKIADMARIAVECESPEDLTSIFTAIVARLQVTNGSRQDGIQAPQISTVRVCSGCEQSVCTVTTRGHLLLVMSSLSFSCADAGYSQGDQWLRFGLDAQRLQGRESISRNRWPSVRNPAAPPRVSRLEGRPTRGVRVGAEAECNCGDGA